MKRARMWISVGCAVVVVVLTGGVVWWSATHDGARVTGCVSQTVSTTGIAVADHDDILLTEQPRDGSVSAYVGQRLVVVLTNNGGGAWVALHVEGSATTLLGSVGAYDYACRGEPPLAELAVLRAEVPGVATVRSFTDAACLHARPTSCTIPQQMWKRTVVVTARSRA
jgi:hypothetical protein